MQDNVANYPQKIDSSALIPVKSQALFRAFAEPNGKVFLLYGDPLIFRLSILMAGYALVRDTTIALVDGCNRFDIHTLIRFAQEKRRSPDELLRRIFVSRGFTCYQMEAAVTRFAYRPSSRGWSSPMSGRSSSSGRPGITGSMAPTRSRRSQG